MDDDDNNNNNSIMVYLSSSELIEITANVRYINTICSDFDL